MRPVSRSMPWDTIVSVRPVVSLLSVQVIKRIMAGSDKTLNLFAASLASPAVAGIGERGGCAPPRSGGHQNGMSASAI